MPVDLASHLNIWISKGVYVIQRHVRFGKGDDDSLGLRLGLVPYDLTDLYGLPSILEKWSRFNCSLFLLDTLVHASIRRRERIKWQ